MTVVQVSWLLPILAVLLFVVVRSGSADRANKRFLNRVKGRKRK